MSTVKDLTPEELTAEIAWRSKVAPIGTAWHQMESVDAAQRQAAAVEKTAATVLALDGQIEEAALFRAAVDIFMDQASGVDTPVRQDVIADNAVRIAKRIQAACRRAGSA